MATRDNPRTSTARRAVSKTSSGPAASGGAKAQAEFQQYKARMAAAGQGQGPGHPPVPGQGPGGAPVYMVPVGIPQGGYQPGGAMPGWAIPPSLASLTQNMAGPGNYASAMVGPGVAAAGSLAERLWSSLGLGLDVLNTALAGSARMLSGLYGGGAYGSDVYGSRHGHGDHGCGCGCGCGSSCCDEDCCGCNPSVGRCC